MIVLEAGLACDGADLPRLLITRDLRFYIRLLAMVDLEILISEGLDLVADLGEMVRPFRGELSDLARAEDPVGDAALDYYEAIDVRPVRALDARRETGTLDRLLGDLIRYLE